MSAIATLTLDIIGRSDKLRAELVKSAKFTKSWASKNRAALNTGAKAFAGTGVAAAAAFGVIYAKAAEAADEIGKTSDKLGIGAKQLQALQHAGELTGVSTKTVNKSLQQMTRSVSEAADGTGEAVGALEKLNLSAEDLKDLSPDQQFAAIADAIKGVKNQSEKVDIAADLFGARGAGLLNTLALGSDGLRDMTQEVDDLGSALSRVDLAKIEGANDAFFRAQQATSSFGKVLTAEAAPLVTALSNTFISAAKEAGGFGVIAKKVVNASVTGFGYVADVVHGLKVSYYALKQVAFELFNVIAKGAAAVAGLEADLREAIGLDATDLRKVQAYSAGFDAEVKGMRAELHALAMEEMPSEAIKRYVEKAQAVAEEAAQAVAAKAKENIGKVYTDPVDVKATVVDEGKISKVKAENDKIVSLHREKFRSIWEANLEANGKFTALEEMRRVDELAAFEEEKKRLIDRNLMTQELKAQFNVMEQMAAQTHAQKLVQIEKEKEDKIAAYKMAMWQVGLNAASTSLGAITDLMEKNGKKQSKLYKFLFINQKAAAIAAMTISTLQASSDARTNAGSVVAGEIMAGVVMGAGMAQVGIAAGTTIAGVAHGGKDYIPSESTWLLDKGERVLSPRQNSDLTSYLSNKQQQQQAPAQAAESTEVNINFQIQALDARDVDRIIVEKQALITSVVEQGLAQTGRRVA